MAMLMEFDEVNSVNPILNSHVSQQEVQSISRVKMTPEKVSVATAMFNNRQKPATVAFALGCSLRKAYQIQHDTFPKNIGELRQSYTPKKRGRKSCTSGKEARQQLVKSILTVEPYLEQPAITELLPTPVHPSTICRDIKAIGWTRKVMQTVTFDKNTPQNLQRRRQYAEVVNQINDNRLIFIDETGHNLHLSTTHGYSASGTPAVRFLNANRGKNLTVIVAIYPGGMLHYKIVDGAANSVIFREFLDELLPFLPYNSVIIMDNVRFHHSQATQQWIVQNRLTVRVEYLPPYSPELNPIEEFFHMEKTAYRKINHPVARSREVMRDRVVNVIESLRLRDLSGLYHHMREFLALAYSG